MRIRTTLGMGTHRAAVAAGLIVAGLPAVTMADPGAPREEQLEQRISELEAQLENVMTAMQANSTSQTTLESRIAELQTSMAEDGEPDPNAMNMYWKKGIRFDSNNKQFKFKLGGRIMTDFVTFDADSDADDFYGSDEFTTGSEFRRARLYIAGTIYGNVGFKAQYDFAGGDADFKDVYVSMKTPIGTAKVGHHHVPFGLEEQTSSKYITFMERGLPASLSPSRKTGVSVQHGWLPKNMKLRTGVFRLSDGYGDDELSNGAGEWITAARLSGIVMEDEEQDMVLALGGSIGQRKEEEGTNSVGLDGNLARYRSRGAQHISTRFIDTGTFEVDDRTTLFGVDAAFGMGPLHAQFEWAINKYEVKNGSDADIEAFGVQAGYFLTGETRKYSAKKMNWDRTSPSSNYGDEEGDSAGAWEVAVRYDSADATDGDLIGGELDQLTFGLNWYLNPNTRIMFNYTLAEVDKLDDGGADYEPEIDIFQVRFQIDF